MSIDDLGKRIEFIAETAEETEDVDEMRHMLVAIAAGRAFAQRRFKAVRDELEAALQRNRDKDDELRRRGAQLDAWQDATGCRTAETAKAFAEELNAWEAAMQEVVDRLYTKAGQGIPVTPKQLHSFVDDVERDVEERREILGLVDPTGQTVNRCVRDLKNERDEAIEAMREAEAQLEDAQAENRRLTERRESKTADDTVDTVDPRPLKAGQKVRILDGSGVLGFETGDIAEVKYDTDGAGGTELVGPPSYTGSCRLYLWSHTPCELVEAVEDEDGEPAKIEEGDRVRVQKKDRYARLNCLEPVVIIAPVDYDGDYYVKDADGTYGYVHEDDVEAVE